MVKVRSTVKWYFESKNIALRKALQIRGPLDADKSNDLRFFYSQYLISLVSATEALLEKEYPFRLAFKNLLYKDFVFDGYPDGKQNYSYLRELRNSIVHRGYDIGCRGSLLPTGLHVLHVPSTLSIRRGNDTFRAFCPFLIGMIVLSESLIGNIILFHFKEQNIIEAKITRGDYIASAHEYINSDSTIPNFARQQISNLVALIDFEKQEKESVAALVSLLSFKQNDLLNALQEISDHN
ncbi:hypothetical protein [Chromobacterium vaccinii]|uniref:hypothetical protein n=1 Tax=Chromobacterium vaccinii TaxID=1108595 RepID=UPI00131A04A3|nr:hypothetical protein [Chromobacterium vaccinii]